MDDDTKKTFKAQIEAYIKERDDLMTPSTLNAAYTMSDFGADLNAIEPFTTELTGIVDKMKEELVNETRILEGTDIPVYNPLEQNELSATETKMNQWTTDLQNGFSTTVLTPTSVHGLSTSSCSVRHNSPVSDILESGVKFCERSTPSCAAIWADCGCATDAMNESSECTVPMINEPTPGMPSEVK